MAKRPDTRETVLLALELLKRIPRSRKVSARDLHGQLPEELSRDLRTVQRQLDMLADAFEIERDDSSKPYGYRWKERAAGLSLPSLTEQESLLLTLAEEHLRNLLPASLMKSMAGFFTQARRRLDPHGDAHRERDWLGKVRVVRETQPLMPPRVAPGIFEVVSNALYADRWLSLDYRNASGRRGSINVMPLGLAQQGPRLYLVCRFEGFDNERSLALHRIAKAEMGAAFARPRGFDLTRYDDDGRFGFGEGRKIRLIIRIDKAAGQHLLESPLSTDQQVRELADSYEISASVVESEQLKWWLRGFGDAVSVKEPRRILSK
jgi:predicted DNA-binding transcriptional regulator YafY